MTRVADERHRSELLDRIVDFVQAEGMSDLSLRPLAKAVRSSPRVLLYYFGSKEEMLVEAIARARERQKRLFERMAASAEGSAIDVCKAAWEIMATPRQEPAFRLFFEIYALALKDPKRYASFLKGAVDDWLAYLETPALHAGRSKAEARAFATVVLAGYRGFMMDLCATHDRARINRSIDLWLDALGQVHGQRRDRRHAPRSHAS